MGLRLGQRIRSDPLKSRILSSNASQRPDCPQYGPGS